MQANEEAGMPRSRKPRVDLSPEQASELARLYREQPELTTVELARRFDLARGSISAIVRRQGVPPREGRPGMSDDQVARVLDLYRDRSLRVREIAQLVGRDSTTIHRLLARALRPEERRGIGRYSNRPRRYAYRADLFLEPLSDDEQWLVGLLLADGTTDGLSTVMLRLAASDRDGVETARRIAGSDAPITTVRNSTGIPSATTRQDLVRWALHSSEVVSRLARLGVLPAKSNRSDIHVPGHLAASPNFWRGLIDGDGTVTWLRKQGAAGVRRSGWLQVLGSEALLRQWAEFVVATIGGAVPRIRPKPAARVLHVSVLSGSRAWLALQLLYGTDGPALARKRDTARAILAETPPTPKPLPIEDVALALDALAGRSLVDLPSRYVCPETGLRLGALVRKARRGQRPDLHRLLIAYDPDWRASATPRP